jgi:Tol biopolymer transport system component
VFLATVTGSGVSLSISRRMVSVNSAGTNGGNGNSGLAMHYYDFSRGIPQVTPDGRYVTFVSDASDLAAGIADVNQGQANTNYRRDIFVRDMQANQTRVVSVAQTGSSTGDSGSYTPMLSNDGRYVAFESDAEDLVSGDGNRSRDVFTRDMTSGITDAASLRTPLFPAAVLALAGGDLADVTPDGRYALFLSRSWEITPSVSGAGNDTQAYVYDRQTDIAQMLSLTPSGIAADHSVTWAQISDDGRFVVFQSQGNGLDAGVTGTHGGVYLRDLATGQTTMISRNTTTGEPADDFATITGSYGFAISSDDRYVAFVSVGTNLAIGVTVTAYQKNLYLYDRQTETLRLLTVNASGTASGNGSMYGENFAPSFSADSRRLVFLSLASDLISGVTDTNGTMDDSIPARPAS